MREIRQLLLFKNLLTLTSGIFKDTLTTTKNSCCRSVDDVPNYMYT